MKTAFYIARRLYEGKSKEQRVSRLARQIATLGVSLGLAIMLLSVTKMFQMATIKFAFYITFS